MQPRAPLLSHELACVIGSRDRHAIVSYHQHLPVDPIIREQARHTAELNGATAAIISVSCAECSESAG